MRAHTMRRGLWGLCLGLGCSLVGLAGWYGLEVRPALASAPFPDAGRVPASWRDRDAAFTRRLRETSTDVLHPALSEAEFRIVLGRSYAHHVHPHFPFTGPEPPPIREIDEGSSQSPDRVPEGLEGLGRVRFVAYRRGAGTTGLVVFDFTAVEGLTFVRFGQPFDARGRTRRVGPDHVLPFVFLRSEELGPRHVLLTYAMRDVDDPGAAPRHLTLEWHDRLALPEASRAILRGLPEVIDPVAPLLARGRQDAPAGEMALSDLEPRFIPLGGPRQRIEFDEATARYVRTRSAAELLRGIKTAERALPSGERGVELLAVRGTVAERFRLKRGDVIVRIQGQPTPTREAILRVVGALEPETKQVSVVIDRHGRKLTWIVDPRDPKERRAIGQAVRRMGERDSSGR